MSNPTGVAGKRIDINNQSTVIKILKVSLAVIAVFDNIKLVGNNNFFLYKLLHCRFQPKAIAARRHNY